MKGRLQMVQNVRVGPAEEEVVLSWSAIRSRRSGGSEMSREGLEVEQGEEGSELGWPDGEGRVIRSVAARACVD